MTGRPYHSRDDFTDWGEILSWAAIASSFVILFHAIVIGISTGSLIPY